jgi:hypothetical protein
MQETNIWLKLFTVVVLTQMFLKVFRIPLLSGIREIRITQKEWVVSYSSLPEPKGLDKALLRLLGGIISLATFISC